MLGADDPDRDNEAVAGFGLEMQVSPNEGDGRGAVLGLQRPVVNRRSAATRDRDHDRRSDVVAEDRGVKSRIAGLMAALGRRERRLSIEELEKLHELRMRHRDLRLARPCSFLEVANI